MSIFIDTMQKRRYIPLILPLLIFWLTGFAGLDYGYHWDEPKLLESVRVSVYEGTYLPTFYNYPSMAHHLAIIAALPEILRNMDRNHLNQPVFHYHIAAYQLDNHSLTLRTRALFLTVSSLAIVWLYLLVLYWRESVWMALFASSVMAFSWEVAYHARWIAPDAILMQFSTLSLLCIVQANRHPASKNWLWASAICAGLATGTKYPAGLLLLPVLMSVYSLTKSKSAILKAVFIFALTYLLTTPGTVLQPFKFRFDVEFEIWHYSFGHSKHSVNGGLEHLFKNIEYLATVQLSHVAIIAFLLFLLALIGMVILWRESRRFWLIVFSFPLIYLLYMSLQGAMLIRNLLVILPFIALACAIGAQWIWYHLPSKILKWAWLALLAGILAVNAICLIYAADTIKDRRSNRLLDETRAWVLANPATSYFPSEHVRANFAADLPANFSDSLQSADEVLVYLHEIQESDEMPANIPRLISTWFGSWEANIEYYTWHGDDKILLLPIETVQRFGLKIPE